MAPASWLQRLALFARRRYRLLLLGFGGLLLLSVVFITRIRFDTDVLNLLPQNDPPIQVFRRTLEEFGTFDNLLIGVRIPEGVPVEPFQELVDVFAEELQGVEELGSVEHRLADPEELLRDLFPGALLFLDESGRERLVERLSDEGIRRRIQELRRLLSTPQGMVLKDFLKLDPLGLSEILLDQLSASRGTLELDWTSGYYLSRDRRMLLLLAKPVEPPQHVDFDRRMVAAVEAARDRALTQWPQLAPESLAPPEILLGGSYLTALDDAQFIQADVVRNTLTSVLGVLILFFFAFRRPSALFYALLPLAAGMVLTFGFFGATLGELSHATSGVAALLIGLGIDFVIVSYGRYVEERRRGESLETALTQMAGSSGRAVVVGAVTTAATFGAFWATDFPALRQMGLMVGTGILFCMISVLVLLPALLAWSEDRHQRRASMPNLYLHSFAADRVIRLSLRHPWKLLLVGLAFTLFTATQLGQLSFQESMETMRPEGNRGLEGAQEVAEHFGAGFDYTMMVVSGQDLDEVLDLADEVLVGAQEMIEDGVLNGVQSVASLMPSPSQQRATLTWLDGVRGEELDADRIRATVEDVMAEEGLALPPFEPGLDLLRAAVERSEPITITDLEASEQGAPLVQQFLRRTDDGWRTVVRLYGPSNLWRREPPPQAESLADRLGPQVELAGTNVINKRVKAMVQRDSAVAGLLGLVLVTLLIWIDFRSLRDTLLSLIPLLIGILWMLGLMGWLGLQANFMNIFVSTMIIGIGVDYGLHMIHRYREIERADDRELAGGLQETGKAILAAAFSTVVGFGSISLSHYPGLRTTGYVAIIGALATAVVSITLVPALLALTHGRSKASKVSEPAE